MTTTPSGVDPNQLWHDKAVARSFRARGEAVYPGRLLVLRADSFAVHPVDDNAFDPATEKMMGIAIWGACDEWTMGMVQVEDGLAGRSVPLIAGELDRPRTGVSKVDAWIARADALRALRRGTVEAFGEIPLTKSQLIASAEEVEMIVRESAIELLNTVPRDQRPALLALAFVADTQHPQDGHLTAAIIELTASAPAWKVPAIDDNGRTKSTAPTMRDLASEAGISDDTFRRIRDAAGITVQLKGAAARNRRYDPGEVDRLIAAALAGNFIERTAIAQKWARWGSK